MQPPGLAPLAEGRPVFDMPAVRVAPNGDIVLLGVAKGTDEKAKKPLDALPGLLTEKGFEVLLFTPSKDDEGATHVLVLRVGARLLVKLAMKLGMPVRSEHEYSTFHRTSIATTLMGLVRKVLSPHFVYRDMSLVHDPAALDRVINSAQPNDIMQYCGHEIALYFAWLHYYTKLLAIPAVVGLLLAIYRASSRADAVVLSVATPLFNVFLCVWGTLLLEGWKRTNASLAYRWGIFNKPDVYNKPNEGGGVPQKGYATGTSDSALFLYGVSLPANVVILVALVRMMLYFVWLSDNAIEVYGRSSWLQYLPTALYSVVPPTAQALYSSLVLWLNDREGHRTREESHSALQLKLFAFQFVNNYCSLFYIAFWQQDMVRLRSMLASLLVTKQIVGNLTEMALPVVQSWMAEVRQEKEQALTDAPTPFSGRTRKSVVLPQQAEGGLERGLRRAFSAVYGKFVARTTANEALKKEKMMKAKEEASAYSVEDPEIEEAVLAECGRDAYDVAVEHTEILIQFGYVTMFAVAFPLAPLFALANNLWEARLDLVKLRVMRRPTPIMARDLGGWATALEVMSFTAVLTNCLLMAHTGKAGLQHLTPAAMRYLIDAPYGRLLLGLALEHILLAFKYLLSALIDDVPQEIREELKREEAVKRDDMFSSKRSLFGSAASRVFNRSSTQTSSGKSPLPQVDGGEAPTAWELLNTHFLTGEIPAFSPLMFLPLMCLPYLVLWLNLSWWWVVPASFLYLSYLHNIKTRHENRSAMAVATDPNVIKLINQHLPPWFFDADLERTQWLSHVLQKLWKSVSGMTDKIVIECVQPILDSSRPAFINRLHLIRCNLGTIAPVVTGVRYVPSPEEVVRLDIHISWAGNPDIVLEVGYKGAPLVLELSAIQFKGKVRVELNPLVPTIPGFAAILCTFMEDPFVNFSFKVGTLDVMAMGAPDMSIADVVANIIRENVLRGFMLYPHSLVIPMLDELDVERLRNPAPKGVLDVMIVSASDLIVADLRSSDPYVKILYGPDQKYKTTVKKATLNPTWNEEFTLNVFDLSQHVYFFVHDHDLVGKHDSLGTYKLKVEDIPPLKPVDLELELNEVKSGSLKVRLFYKPLKKEDGEDEEEEDDSLASDDITFRPGLDVSLEDDEEGEGEGGDVVGRLRRSSNAAEDRVGGSARSRMTTQDSLGGSGGKGGGVLQVEGFQLKGYSAKHHLMSTTKVALHVAVGNTANRTAYVRAPCQDPVFQDRFTFQLSGTTATHGSLQIQIIERTGIGSQRKLLGHKSIELATLCKKSGRIDQEWPIESKGKVYSLHMITTYAALLDVPSRANSMVEE